MINEVRVRNKSHIRAHKNIKLREREKERENMKSNHYPGIKNGVHLEVEAVIKTELFNY